MRDNFTIDDLPESERPRERIMNVGPQALSSQELLTLIISRGVAGKSASTIAQNILSRFGNLGSLCDVTIDQLCQIEGIGPAKAAQIVGCFEISRRVNSQHLENSTIKKITIDSPETVFKLVKPLFRDRKREYLVILPLDSRNQLIRRDIISIGGLNQNFAHPRDIFKEAIAISAASIVLVHNHPSGNPDPSENDQIITNKIIEAGDLLGIDVFDHVIIGQDSFFSFRNQIR